jgi:type IV pilus assembly protein PilW
MKKHQTTWPQRRSTEAGVTLIELMVALLLGLILIGGAIQVFTSNRAAYGFNEGFSRLQENGRFALDTLNFRGRMAGYLGCLSGATVYNHIAGASASLAFNIGEGLRGYEGVGSSPGQTVAPASSNPANSMSAADWAPALPAALVGSVIPRGDVLVIRNVSPSSLSLVSPFTNAAQAFAGGTPADVSVGEIAVVSDCQKASIFQVTNVSNNPMGGVDVVHSNSGAVSPGNVDSNWPTPQEDYGPGAELLRAETWIYYVGARAADGRPGLFQRRLRVNGAGAAVLAAEEIAEGVEMMQVRYGVDANLDGAIEQYVTANAVADWARIASVRVSIVVRSPEEYGTEVDDTDYVVDETTFNPVDDRRVRQVFVSTIAIRNRLP